MVLAGFITLATKAAHRDGAYDYDSAERLPAGENVLRSAIGRKITSMRISDSLLVWAFPVVLILLTLLRVLA